MSGTRPLLRSPWFGEGMMSETIEESGSNVRMLAAVLGTGRARWRFESDPDDTVGPVGMVQLKSDGERRTVQGPHFSIHSLLFI